MRKYFISAIALLLLSVSAAQADFTGKGDYFYSPQWDDTMVPALSARLGATNPGDCNFAGDATLVKGLCFDGAGANEEVHFTVQLPHGYRTGSTLKPHVHWTPTTADAGNVVWQFEYTVQEVGGTFAAGTLADCTTTAAGGTAWVHKITACPDIDDSGLGISSVMYGRLMRDGDHASDTYEADVALIGFDIHFEMDSPGSAAPTSK